MVITTQQNSHLRKCWKQFWATSEGWNKLVYCYSFFWHLVQCRSTFHKKSKHYWPWLDSQSQIHNRQKEEVPEQLAMEDPAPSVMSSSPSAAMQRGSRHQNSPEPIILGNVVSSTKSSNDTSSWKANKQTKFKMQSFTVYWYPDGSSAVK